MKNSNLDSRIAEIRNSGDYMLNHALVKGASGAYNYHPRTPEQKEAYQLGISKWLEDHRIREVNPADLAHGTVLKGFIYGLFSQPVHKFLANSVAFVSTFGNEDPIKMPRDKWKEKSKQQKSLEMHLINEAARRIKACLEEYDALERFGEEIKKEKELFKKGLKLVDEYVEKRERELFIEDAKRCYGIDPRKISPKRLKKYSEIHADLHKKVALCEEGQHYMLAGIELYHSKSRDLDESLMAGDSRRALDIADYLRFLLDQLDLYDREPKIGLGSPEEFSDDEEEKDPEERKQEILDMLNRSLQDMRDDEERAGWDDEIIEAAVKNFDIPYRIRELNEKRKEIARRMENPSYDFEQRTEEMEQKMNALVASEKYEEAAKIRDELKKLHGTE